MLKKIILVLGALGVSSAALAHDGWDHDRDRDRFREQRVERFHEARRPVAVAPAPRVVYAPPAPVAYPQPGVSVDIHVPL